MRDRHVIHPHDGGIWALPKIGARLVSWWRGRREASRFAARAALLMVAFYSVVYYPHADGSVAGRLLLRYLESLAWISGACLSLVDSQVSVQGVFILGRAPLQIVLDCAALDALALFAASVVAFPAPLRRKLVGFVVGGAIIWGFNVLRIVLLYVAGVRSPRLFDVLHEDVMAVLLVLVSVGCFAVWAALSRHLFVRRAARVASTV
jgi:exosortase/archaeosortase family protein